MFNNILQNVNTDLDQQQQMPTRPKQKDDVGLGGYLMDFLKSQYGNPSGAISSLLMSGGLPLGGLNLGGAAVGGIKKGVTSLVKKLF